MICSFRPYKGGNPKHVQWIGFARPSYRWGRWNGFSLKVKEKQGKNMEKVDGFLWFSMIFCGFLGDSARSMTKWSSFEHGFHSIWSSGSSLRRFIGSRLFGSSNWLDSVRFGYILHDNMILPSWYYFVTLILMAKFKRKFESSKFWSIVGSLIVGSVEFFGYLRFTMRTNTSSVWCNSVGSWMWESHRRKDRRRFGGVP